MNSDEIISYIKQNKGAEIAMLQQKFDITFKDAKSIIDELLSAGELVYTEGIRYDYIERKPNPEQHNGDDSSEKHEDSEEDFFAKRRSYLEARRLGFFRRLQSDLHEEDDDEDDNDEDCDDEDASNADSFGIDIDSDFYEALKIAVKDELQTQMVDCHLLQIELNISMKKAMNIIKWMESNGFVGKGEGLMGELSPRDVLISKKRAAMWLAEFACDESLLNEVIAETYLDNIDKSENESISADVLPSFNLWLSEDEFGEVVMERIMRLIKSDKRMGQKGAVKKAEAYLEAVRDTNDRKMVQVYERLVYEIKNTSVYLYNQLKKQAFN